MRAVALWEFTPTSKDQLGFAFNDELLLLREETSIKGWGYAALKGKEGFVPLNYLKYEKPAAAPVAPPRRDVIEEEEALLSPRSTIEKERAALLAWVQSRIPDYHVRNFSTCWRDGKAIMALVNSLRPGTFDLPGQFRLPEENAELAMRTAEELLEIPATLSATEFCSTRCLPERVELYVRGYWARQRYLLEKADAEERALRRKGARRKAALAKPSAKEVWCNVVSKTGRFHASISFEGIVTDRFGDLLGYLDLEGMRAASKVQELLGYMSGEYVYDARTGVDGECCGEINRGTGSIHDRHGSTIVKLDLDGSCRGQTQVYLGMFEGVTLRELPVVALYCIFIDPDFYDETAEDEPERSMIEPPQDALVWIFDKEGQFRAAILSEEADGKVIDCFGDCIGYVDVSGMRCASSEGQLLGSVLGNTIIGPNDAHLGEFDMGRGDIVGANGSSVLTFETTGHCKGATSVYLGEFRGWSFRELPLVALYVLLLDQEFVSEN